MGDEDIATIHTESLREFFGHEENGFTPWLEKNIDKLSDDSVLGFEITNIDTEKYIEGYKADIIAECPGDNRTVIIENQFEGADSDHFGRSLMYAANEGADIIVWIAEDIENAYAEALHMLNRRTDQKFGIYGIEARIIRIGDSPPCGLEFTPVVKPEDWQPPESELNKSDRNQKQFWEEFRATLRDKNLDDFAKRSSGPSASYHVDAQTPRTYIRPTINHKSNRMYVIIRMYDRSVVSSDDHKTVFLEYVENAIKKFDTQLDPDITDKIEFEETPDNEFDKIKFEYTESVDFYDPENWDIYQSWLIDVIRISDKTIKKLYNEGRIAE